MGEIPERIYRGLVIAVELLHQSSGAIAAHAQHRDRRAECEDRKRLVASAREA